jgi:hypothetical protein
MTSAGRARSCGDAVKRPRYSTKDVLLAYLRADTQPRWTTGLLAYMAQMHKVSPGATRTQLYRLVRAGKIERVDLHWYRLVGA